MLKQLSILAVIFYSFFNLSDVWGQIDPNDRKILFREDTKLYKERLRREKKNILKKDDVPHDQGVYFNAPQLEFRQDEKEYYGSGGVIISYGGNQFQAERGKFNTDTKQAELEGDVLLASPEGQLLAQRGWFDLEKEIGTFEDASFNLEVEGFRARGDSVEKLSELDYRLEDAEMTTCSCADGSKPWSISSDRIDITAGGYAKARPFFLECNDVPVLYSPYFIFPARLERHSGLLIPQIGFSGEDGFQYTQPIFWNFDHSTDVMLTPFTETLTRSGTRLGVSTIFSLRSRIDSEIIYSNESARGDNLRGTQTEGIFDPEFDKNRFGGYYRQRWRAAPGELPLSFVADGRYVSDNLFVREIEDDNIGLPQDRFITSRASLRSPIGDYLNAQIGTEYSQSFVSDQDFVFQRLPEASIDGYRSLRVFGQNKYGLKLISSGGLTSTTFNRSEGYDGNRFDINPRFKIPYYYKNIVDGDINFGVRQTWYRLSDTLNPDTGLDLEDSTDRSIYDVGFNIGSVLERVYDVDPDSWLRGLTSVGARNQYDELQRFKHTIEPYIQYRYTPEVDQSDLPLFDATDRIRDASIFTYGIVSRMIGRFADSAEKRGVIDELTPEQVSIVDLNNEATAEGQEAFDPMFIDENATIKRIRGDKKELVVASLRQSYDRKLEDTDVRPWSDVGADLSVYPNNYFGIGFGSNYDYEGTEFSSWGLGVKLEDDRGDHIRSRVSYVENVLSQVDTNLELVLTDRLKVGYYTKYDEQDSEFIENRVALRILSSCDCWKIDIGYSDRINPDDQSYTLLLTLKGLGDFGQ